LACEYLVNNGYKILERNYRINFGEIDIIAGKKCGLMDFFKRINPSINSGQAIHFVEVKSLANPADDFFPEQRVDYKKQRKLKQLAEIWLSKNKMPQNTPCQIDIVAVLVNGADSKPKIDFFENVVDGGLQRC